MAKEEVKVDEKERRKRIPFGAHRTKLQVEGKIPGYHLRWFNDVDGGARLARAERGGYKYVMSDEVPELGQGALHQKNSALGSRVSKIVSRGEPIITAYLMKIEQEWYDADQQAKWDAIDAKVEAIRDGKPGGNVVENQYVPEGHVQKIS
jgi:hypothetical protein